MPNCEIYACARAASAQMQPTHPTTTDTSTTTAAATAANRHCRRRRDQSIRFMWCARGATMLFADFRRRVRACKTYACVCSFNIAHRAVPERAIRSVRGGSGGHVKRPVTLVGAMRVQRQQSNVRTLFSMPANSHTAPATQSQQSLCAVCIQCAANAFNVHTHAHTHHCVFAHSHTHNIQPDRIRWPPAPVRSPPVRPCDVKLINDFIVLCVCARMFRMYNV